MAKALNQATKGVDQTYRTKAATQSSFRPRYDPRANAVQDATKDVNSLLASKAQGTNMQHDISVGMAKTMATDHIMALDEEIKFINGTMKPGDSRDIAIKRLQGSIATTSGVSAGLSGNAAQAYDELYVPGARKMASSAMYTWGKEQDDIDLSLMKSEFSDFLAMSGDLDQGTARSILSIWDQRLKPFTKGGETGAYEEAANTIVSQVVAEALKDPTLTPVEIANKFKNKDYMGLVSVDDAGSLSFGREDPINNAKMAKVFATIFDSSSSYSSAEKKRVTKENEKIRNDAEQKVLTIVENEDSTTKEGAKKIKEAIAMYAPWLKDQGVEVGNIASSISMDNLIGKESGGDYTVWNGGTKASRAGQENKRGGKYTTAFGKYQFVKKTAQEYWNKAIKAGTITQGGPMVHGKQTPAQQDAMQKILLKDQIVSMKRQGVPVNPDNLYTVHQLGMGRAQRFFNDTLIGSDLVAMNDQLPKNERSPFPEISGEEVISAWSSKYRNYERGNVTGNYTEAMSKKAVSISAKLAKKSRTEQESDLKDNKDGMEAHRKEMRTNQSDLQKVLDEKARITRNPDDINSATKHRHSVEQDAANYGENAVFSEADIREKNIADLKVIDAEQKRTLDSAFKEAIAIAKDSNQPVTSELNKILERDFTTTDKNGKKTKESLVSREAQEKLNNFMIQHAAIEKQSMLFTLTEQVEQESSKGMSPQTLRTINTIAKQMSDSELESFRNSKIVKDIIKYESSPKYNLDKAKEAPLNMTVNNLPREDAVKLRDYRTTQIKDIFNKAQQKGGEAARTKIIEMFGNDPYKSLDANQKKHAAASIVKDVLYDINQLSASMQNMPEFWNSPASVGAAKTSLNEGENIALSVSMTIIRSTGGAELDPMISQDILRFGKSSMLGEVIKDINGDDIDYHNSPEYEKFVSDNVIGGFLLTEEKVEYMHAARVLVASGRGSSIPSLLSSAVGKYSTDIDGLKGRFQSSGLNDQLAEANGDQEDLSELVITSMSRENPIGYNEAKNGYEQKMLDGEFTIGTDGGGYPYIIFPDSNKRYSHVSPRFHIDLSKLSVTRASSKKHDFFSMDLLAPGGLVRAASGEIEDIIAPELGTRIGVK